MKKTLLMSAALSFIYFLPQSANAALLNGSVLNFDTPAISGNHSSLNSIGPGSWFALESSPGSFVATGISGAENLVLGTTQSAPGSATAGNIDNSWMFSGIQGVHESTANTNIITSSGDTATIDFSGWGIFWNGSSISLNSGASNGLASVICDTGSGCANGAGYTLDYFATSFTSGQGDATYALHLEGTISSVPLPSAFWLLGSALIALTGFRRNRQQN